jgi:hypothetical protein
MSVIKPTGCETVKLVNRTGRAAGAATHQINKHKEIQIIVDFFLNITVTKEKRAASIDESMYPVPCRASLAF